MNFRQKKFNFVAKNSMKILNPFEFCLVKTIRLSSEATKFKYFFRKTKLFVRSTQWLLRRGWNGNFWTTSFLNVPLLNKAEHSSQTWSNIFSFEKEVYIFDLFPGNSVLFSKRLCMSCMIFITFLELIKFWFINICAAPKHKEKSL